MSGFPTRRALGLDESFVFEPIDLVEGKNPQRVFAAISQLADYHQRHPHRGATGSAGAGTESIDGTPRTAVDWLGIPTIDSIRFTPELEL